MTHPRAPGWMRTRGARRVSTLPCWSTFFRARAGRAPESCCAELALRQLLLPVIKSLHPTRIAVPGCSQTQYVRGRSARIQESDGRQIERIVAHPFQARHGIAVEHV